MKRIAFFGPLPPLNTGIADYDSALLPLLREDYEIDVFAPERSPHSRAFHHGEFLLKHQLQPYDLLLYQMGNQPRFHEYMYGYLFQHPGAVVFHDYCLHHSRADMLLKRNKIEDYRQELQAVYPDQARRIANAAVTFSAGDLLFFYYPLFELIVRSSLAAAAHTQEAVKKLQICDTPVVRIPLIQLPAAKGTNEGMAPGATVIASFGYATHAKRISTILESVAQILPEHPDVRYVIVGSVEDPAWLQQRIDSLNIGQAVVVTGHVEMPNFLIWMARADIVVNLRYPSAGEMSATLIQALATGKPVIISRLLNLEQIPEDVVMRVRPDREKEDLTSSLKKLIRDPKLREQLSVKAKTFIEKHHSPEMVREGYARLIEAAMERKPEFQSPSLPVHLRSANEMLRDNLIQTSFAGLDEHILSWVQQNAGFGRP